jgi:flagellar protein FliS
MKFVGKKYSDNEAETAVSSSNSRELIILVYERIFDQLRSGKFELSQGRFGIEFFTKASDLINLGLLASLDLKKGGEIASNLKSLYEWSLRSINEARINKSEEKIQEVIDVLIPLYEAWKEIA